jgi:Ca-activated chloride channel family protein
VSFGAPLFLLALLLLPLLALAYLRADRRGRQAADAFATPALQPSVAPSRPGWRRHAAAAVYGLAFLGLILALARPEVTVAVARDEAAVVLATDGSGSMEARDVSPSRLAAAREAAGRLIDDAPDDLGIGAITFNHAVRAISAPSTEHERARQAIERLRPSGGTATGEALASSLALVEKPRGRRVPAAIVLLSDGASTHGREPLPFARRARRARIPVYTVALGTDRGTIDVRSRSGATERRRVPPDRDTLRRIARTSGGQFFEASDADQLGEIYARLGSRVAKKDERREVTFAFAALAGLLLLGGGGMSLRWFGRLP